MLAVPLVSLDPYKRAKIGYAAGFVVAGLTLLFLSFTANPSKDQAMVLGGLSLAFLLTGAFLYLRAGKIHLCGTFKLNGTSLIVERIDHTLEQSLKEMGSVRFTDEGFHKLHGNHGKIFGISFKFSDEKEWQHFQLFFVSEKEVAEFLRPIKAAGLKTEF
ncbi:MAG: hypothetical protein ACK40M_13885 [Flavobacteriales bacterium]